LFVSETYVAFRAALSTGDHAGAFEAARSLPGLLSLLDALELVLLTAEKGGQRLYDDCAARWLARVTVEKGLQLPQVIQVAELLRSAPGANARDLFAKLSEYTA
jgi:hypothetical protein